MESKPGLGDLLVSHCVAVYWALSGVMQGGTSGGSIVICPLFFADHSLVVGRGWADAAFGL